MATCTKIHKSRRCISNEVQLCLRYSKTCRLLKSTLISKSKSNAIQFFALANEGFADIFSCRWFSFAGGIVVIEPMVKIYVDGIWSTWQRTLKDQKPNDLRLMSEKIWRNTLRPVSNLLKRHTTPREFCLNVTGESLRWEIVGIIVSLVSLLAQSLTG